MISWLHKVTKPLEMRNGRQMTSGINFSYVLTDAYYITMISWLHKVTKPLEMRNGRQMTSSSSSSFFFFFD